MGIYVFDLDGTLSDCSHRQDYALNKDWETFHSLCHLDEPYPNIVRLFNDLDDSAELIIVTGRTEEYRAVTTAWLKKHNIYPDALLMRPTGDFRPDIEIKLELVRERYGTEGIKRIVAWFEDRDHLVEQLRNEGLTVLQVKAGGY